MIASSCGDGCGWAAAVLSCVAFGTFGVPIKGDAADSVDVDPLVFQSYKTAMVLLTAPLVALLGGPECRTFSPWGIVSGLFWVPAGVAAVYAVRSAGLAVSQGTWSSVIVLVSFVWGIGVFGERVESFAGASVAVFCMVAGLWGMSYYSSPGVFDGVDSTWTDEEVSMGSPRGAVSGGEHGPKSYQAFQNDEGIYTTKSFPRRNDCGSCSGGEETEINEEGDDEDDDDDDGEALSEHNGAVELTQHDIGMRASSRTLPDAESFRAGARERVKFGAYSFSRRRIGLASAVFNGVWGGSIMVPMHYAKGGKTSGLGYVVSFAVGAALVTALMWILRFCYHILRTPSRRSVSEGFASLPSFHFHVMWLPGGIAGALWSIGNICSMVSVEHLGEGVGYSVVQASMLMSGLWGIYWFREVEGFVARAKWLAAALVTILGILMLSYEHKHR